MGGLGDAGGYYLAAYLAVGKIRRMDIDICLTAFKTGDECIDSTA